MNKYLYRVQTFKRRRKDKLGVKIEPDKETRTRYIKQPM